MVRRRAPEPEDLAGVARELYGNVSMIAEFTASVALRAVAEYLAERENGSV
jgi:hypothetical protein